MGKGEAEPNQTCRHYPEGGRAWKQVNGVTTLYLELDGIEWGSYEPAGTLKERTIRASGTGGAVVAVHAPTGGLIRLLPNRQGSVIGWLRPDGKLGGAYTYDGYGNSPQAGAGGPAFRYAGIRFDAETGLYHTPNRAYDPADGRWMQLDPIGIKDGLNRYAYVKNSPLMGVDPTGRSWEDVGNVVFGLSEVVVGATGVGVGVTGVAAGSAVTVGTGGAAAPASIPTVVGSAALIGASGALVGAGYERLNKGLQGIAKEYQQNIVKNEESAPKVDGKSAAPVDDQPDERGLSKVKEKDANKIAKEHGYKDAHEAKDGRGDSKVNIYKDKETCSYWVWDGKKNSGKDPL